MPAIADSRLDDLCALAQSHADEAERLRRLPDETVRALRDAGVFRLCVARELGGLEAPVADTLETIEKIAWADGSTGWCAMIGATSGLVSGYLPRAEARLIYGDRASITGGVFAPHGRARREGDLYVATGRWPFASGCQHCTWLMGGCLIDDGGVQSRARMLLFPAGEVVVHDTWEAAGLRGTGSHDMEVRNVRVPVGRSVSLSEDRPRNDGVLYRFPVFGLLALGIAAVALGIGVRACEELERLATSKRPTGSRRGLGERSAVQAAVARSRVELAAARSLTRELVARAAERTEHGELSVAERAQLRAAATYATRSAARAVDRMYEAGGGTSVYAASALQRCFRDVHVATQHLMVSPATYELVGRIRLGIDTDLSLL